MECWEEESCRKKQHNCHQHHNDAGSHNNKDSINNNNDDGGSSNNNKTTATQTKVVSTFVSLFLQMDLRLLPPLMAGSSWLGRPGERCGSFSSPLSDVTDFVLLAHNTCSYL